MELHAPQMPVYRRLPRFASGLARSAIIIGAFATAAVLAALYGPGRRETAALRQSILPTTAAAADTLHASVSRIDQSAARKRARRKLAEALDRLAAREAVPTLAPSVQTTGRTRHASAAAPRSALLNLTDKDFEKLANKATEAIRIGDIAGARLVLERAVSAGDTTALYALAETYDPRVLARLHVRGMKGDPEKARALYEQALARGVTKARAKLESFGK